MKKMLAGFIMDGHGGGIDNYLLNFLDNTASEELQIDFLTNEIDSGLEKHLQKYHSRIFAIANLKHPVTQYRQICGILEKGQYDMVYLNISTAIDCVAAVAAKKCKVKRIMVHSHSSGNDCGNTVKRMVFNSIHSICRLFLYRNATEYYGCSKEAGCWLFPKRIVSSPKFRTVFNAVDLNRYSYSPEIRKQVREELKLENKFVVGHVGNFLYAKNHYFLIDIFEELIKQCPDAVLVLAGKGDRMENVKRLVKEKGLQEYVRILGFRKDVERIFQGMDFFLLPSYFEGLPTVSIEAQCTGLPCLMSENVPDAAKITEKCWFLSLKKSPREWAEFILAHREKDREKINWLGEKENYSLQKLKEQQTVMINR